MPTNVTIRGKAVTTTGGGGGGGGTGTFVYPFAQHAVYKPIPLASIAPVHPDSQYILAHNNWQPANNTLTWFRPEKRADFIIGDLSQYPPTSVYVNVPGCATTPKFTDVPIPTQLATTPMTAGDAVVGHLDTVNGDYYEAWRVSAPGTPNLGGSGAAAPGDCASTRWNSVIWNRWLGVAYDPTVSASLRGTQSASHIAMAAGILFPEDFYDLSLASVIPHALRMDNFCGSNGTTYPTFVLPALGSDGRQAIGVPCGCRVRLKPALDVNNWPSLNTKFPKEPMNSAVKKICRTLQQYGVVQVDSTGAIGAGSFEACAPETLVLNPKYATFSFPWEDPASNYGWSYGSGLPWDLMAPANWDVMDWNFWTGA